jgi:hypothetical protein
LEDMDQDGIMIFQMMAMACNSNDFSLHMKWRKREKGKRVALGGGKGGCTSDQILIRSSNYG